MPAGSLTAAATNLSMFGLFLQADFVVKTVIIVLALASVWSWAIIFEKVILLRSATEDAKKFESQFWSGGSLDEMFDKLESKPFRLDPMSAVFVAAMREWRRSSGALGTGGVHGTSLNQRIDRVMQITMDREMDRVEKRMTFLASTGAVSPFIGLFGTVWGIMNSFHNIGS
ncbi:MAG: MotA/TolQ/ExbB proton channel family protein, partial [Alphaproteobacteria bacterium]